MSYYKFLHAGVPQGSVLGPLLFLIYVNDVAENMTSLCRLYADNNSVQYCSTNIDSIQLELNNDLHRLDLYSKQWWLNNPSETKAIFCSTRKGRYPCLEFQKCVKTKTPGHYFFT